MKKILTHLTGIVFVITILVAVGCGNSNKKNDPSKEEKPPAAAIEDSTKVDIFLKAILIDGNMHLEMYDSKKPLCPVIDNLTTVVYPEYTVTWRKADNSIKTIEDISSIYDDGKIFSGINDIEPKSLWQLVIPITAEPDTVKYLIKFTIQEDKDTTYIIDPYLKIPKKPAAR